MKPILIVEDNDKNLKLARDVLEASGFRTLAAADGPTGVALAATHHPDVVLMDIQLPGMDGVEALGELREDDRTASIPVVAVTAYAMKGDEQRALDAGCDGYVTKPIDTETLADTVARYLAEPR